MSDYNEAENDKVVSDLGSRFEKELRGDEDNFIFRIDCAIAFHKMGGASSAYLRTRALKFGAAEKQRPNQSAEHWLLPGLLGIKLKNYAEGKPRKEISGRLTEIGRVMQAAAYNAEGLGGILNPSVTAAGIAETFGPARQSSVRDVLKEQRAAGAALAHPSGSDDDVSADAAPMDFSEAIKVLKAKTELAKLNLVLDRPGEVIVLVGYRDEDGDHLTTQVSLDPKALMALLPKPSLKDLDGRVNGICDHLLISKHLIKSREVDLPSIATDPNSARLKAVRATLLHDKLMETSISMVGAPEMLVVTELDGTSVFRDDHYVVSANSRNAFEKKVAEPLDRIGFDWGSFTDAGVEFKKGTKTTTLKVLDASDWGSGSARDPWAHRLGKWAGTASVCVSPSQVSAIKETYLVRGCRKDLQVDVALNAKGASFKLGRAAAMKFEATPGEGEFKAQTVRVPAPELADVLELAISRSTDGQLYLDADPAGVLKVSFKDYGAVHSVYLAKVTDAGARENGSVFQRYTKADFASADQREAA